MVSKKLFISKCFDPLKYIFSVGKKSDCKCVKFRHLTQAKALKNYVMFKDLTILCEKQKVYI